MTLFAVSLLFSLEVQVSDLPEPVRELAIYLLSANDTEDAKAKGERIGKAREISYENAAGEVVRDCFKAVVEVQLLYDTHIFDGMEVSSWLYRGDRLVIEEGRITATPAATTS